MSIGFRQFDGVFAGIVVQQGICPVLDEFLHGVHVPRARGPQQRRVAVTVQGVHLRFGLDQELDAGSMATLSCVVQSSGEVFVGLSHVGGTVFQELLNDARAAIEGSNHQWSCTANILRVGADAQR
eukprot:Skav217681  [mRNA]  locus=scaffold2919:470857:476258:+ [translate_table: standard]